MLLKRYTLYLLLLLSPLSIAESYVYLTNNTMENLTLETTQSGHGNIVHGDQWQQLATQVAPLETVRFLRFNRDQGIKWGKEYVFTTQVQTQSKTLSLTQKLKGTMTFSKMWLSAQQDPWHYDRDIHNVELDSQRTLAFRSEYARASGDDIRYVIHDEFQPPQVPNYSNQLSVLNYNTWALLPGITARNTGNRLDTIVQYTKGYDVVVFEEVFDPYLTARFRDALRAEYPYQSDIPWKIGKLLTGGSFIASRWPMNEHDAVVYDACRSDGCLAGKGINYAQITKGTNQFHIFGTHTHAYTEPEDIAIRFAQLAQFKSFVNSKNIPAHEPVIMAGDFNVDKLNFPAEHQDFLSLLNATEPQALGEFEFSYAGLVNIYAEAEFNEYLDYVLYSNEHLVPFEASNTLLTPRSITSKHWGSWDLSDHFPVAGYFEFPMNSEYVGE